MNCGGGIEGRDGEEGEEEGKGRRSRPTVQAVQQHHTAQPINLCPQYMRSEYPGREVDLAAWLTE